MSYHSLTSDKNVSLNRSTIDGRILSGRPSLFPAVMFCFFSAGFLYAQFMARMPALVEYAALDEAGLGLLLMCFAGGSVLGLCSSGFMFRIMQSKSLISGSFFVFCLTLGAVKFIISSPALLTLSFVLWGFCFACIDVSMNTQGMLLERRSAKRFLASLHAGFSIGCVCGSLYSSLFAAVGLSLVVSYSLSAALIFIAFFAFFRRGLLSDTDGESTSDLKGLKSVNADTKRLPAFVFICGIVAMSALAVEGAGSEWGGVILYSAKGADESVAALAYGFLACSMAVTRLMTDRIRSFIDDTLLLYISSFTALIALIGIIYTDSSALCLFFFILLGIGCAPADPIAFSRAGNLPGVSPKDAATLIGVIGYSGMFAVPPVIGFAADYVGIEKAMFIPVVCIFVIVLLVPAFRMRR